MMMMMTTTNRGFNGADSIDMWVSLELKSPPIWLFAVTDVLLNKLFLFLLFFCPTFV